MSYFDAGDVMRGDDETGERVALPSVWNRCVIGEFEAKYGVRAPYVPSPNTATVLGRVSFTVLETKG